MSDQPPRLRLFIAGREPNSLTAIENMGRLKLTYLHQGWDYELIDVLEDFRVALECNVLVTPALLIDFDGYRATVFGTLADTARVLAALGISPEAP